MKRGLVRMSVTLRPSYDDGDDDKTLKSNDSTVCLMFICLRCAMYCFRRRWHAICD